MERNMMKLGRAKKKLRYFQADESTPCRLKIQDVFTLRDIDNFLDDLDSPDSGTPLLSPLPKTTVLSNNDEDGYSPLMLKPSSPFGVEEPEALAVVNGSQEDHLIDKGSPLEEIAPIKTSSPIDLMPVNKEAREEERPDSSVLLGAEEEVEDERPIRGDMSKPSSCQKADSPKEVQGDSGSLVSPPSRLEFRNATKQNLVSVSRCMPLPSSPEPVLECEISGPEMIEELQTGERQCLVPSVLLTNSEEDPLLVEQPKIQGSEVKLNEEVKESSFQQKLRDALKPKTLWKQESQQPQTRPPPPLDLDDDFLILEDDAPVLFTIPRKSEAAPKEKSTQESSSSKPGKSRQAKPASPKKREEAEKRKDEADAAKKKSKSKSGKANGTRERDAVTQTAVEEMVEPLKEADDVFEQISPLTPETVQDSEPPGKQETKSKESRSYQISNKAGRDDVRPQTSSQKPASKRKKSAKLTTNINTGEEDIASNVNKKPSKVKSTNKVPETETVGPAKPNNKPGKDKATVNKRVSEEEEHGEREHDFTEPQPEVQSAIPAVRKAKKQASIKKNASRKPAKAKKAEKSKEVTKEKELPAPESDASAEDTMTGKRKRRPPGEWWLTGQNEPSVQEPGETVQQPSAGLKPIRKTKRKEAPKVQPESAQEQLAGTSQESQSKPSESATAPKKAKKLKKSQPDGLARDSAHGRKNPKALGAKRNPKLTTSKRHVTRETAPDAEVEGHEDVGQLSPMADCPPPRQHSVTPGQKRVFDKVYSRDDQGGPSQNCLPESLHEKRQRKPPSNWWEIPTSHEASSSMFDRVSSVVSMQRKVGRAQTKSKFHMINTPKSVKRSLAAFDAILASGNPESDSSMAVGSRQRGRRNLLHSLEDEEQSSENVQVEEQQQRNSNATFDVYESVDASEPSVAKKKTAARISTGSNRASEYDLAFKSGPSSMIELERFEEHQDSELPSSRMIHHNPRVLSDCELCGPPLRPVVLEPEDWNNLCVWFTHLWPPASKNGQVISPDDFHWHAHNGRAMGHMVDLQSQTFSNGKILLGSYMKKPPQMDLNAVTVFNVCSSCVRVEIEGVKTVYNPGQTFMTQCGQLYSIHNICREPAVLWYNRMLPGHTRS